jgi:cytochrome P450
MCLDIISGDGLEFVVPKSGAEIAGTWVPRGTITSVSSRATNHAEIIWGPGVDLYNPDRWTKADEIQRRGMKRSSTAFSAGKRICLGQHIAWLEMKKLIPHLLTTYNVSLDLFHSPKPKYKIKFAAC